MLLIRTDLFQLMRFLWGENLNVRGNSCTFIQDSYAMQFNQTNPIFFIERYNFKWQPLPYDNHYTNTFACTWYIILYLGKKMQELFFISIVCLGWYCRNFLFLSIYNNNIILLSQTVPSISMSIEQKLVNLALARPSFYIHILFHYLTSSQVVSNLGWAQLGDQVCTLIKLNRVNCIIHHNRVIGNDPGSLWSDSQEETHCE